MSLKPSVPVTEPTLDGIKETATVQELFTGSVVPQVFAEIMKGAAVLIAILSRAAEPLFCSVTVCAAEEAPTAVSANANEDGLRDADGATP